MTKPSKRKKHTKARIGDVVEIKTSAGFGYIQYTHETDPMQGQLVRVLPGLYSKRPDDLAELAKQIELYFIFFILDYGFRTGIGQMEIVSNEPIPEWAKPYPLMRHAAAFDDFGRVIRWRIISAKSKLTPAELMRTPLLTELTPEQKKMSVYEIWPPAAMVKELARGWTPEHSEEMQLKDLMDATAEKGSFGSTDRPTDELMRHYIYFAKRTKAKEAGELLLARGFSVEIRKRASEENWLVLASKSRPKTDEQMDDMRDQLESLATQFDGDYDGWEAAIDSLPVRGSKFGRAVN